MVLAILIASAAAAGLLIGGVAGLSPKELAAECLLLCLTALAFYGLVVLL